MKIKVFKRQSDEQVLVADLHGPGVWPHTDDQLFINLFGSLETYEAIEDASPPTTWKIIDIVTNAIQYTQYTQEEIDGKPENLRKKYIEEAKQGLLDAVTVADIQKHTCVLNGVCQFQFIQAGAEIV